MGFFKRIFTNKRSAQPTVRVPKAVHPWGGLYLNRVAQGLESFDTSVARFAMLQPAEQIEVLRRIEFMASQASATQEDSAAAIVAANAAHGFVPAWVPNNSCVHIQSDYAGVPISELANQFRYLMQLFAIADSRRRKLCGPKCNHWWHHLEKHERTS